MGKRIGWIGVDLDGTLAVYDGYKGLDVIGAPIPSMVERVKKWLAAGREVRILTARVSQSIWRPRQEDIFRTEQAIKDWCLEHIGQALRVTCIKDFEMDELWDDRAIQVVPNTGQVFADLLLEANQEIVRLRAERNELMRDSIKLELLEAGGVDNWDWYGESLKDYEQRLKEAKL